MTSRKDVLASFIWTTGAADMVIGGVSERGSLFTLGLLTVGAGLLVRWLRQQRYGRTLGSGRIPSRGPFPGQLPLTGRVLSGKARGASAFLARQFRQVNAGGGPSRSRRGYSTAARPGFRANDFVHSSPVPRRRAQAARSPVSGPPPPSSVTGSSVSAPSVSQPANSRTTPRSAQGDPQSARTNPGPPLNLPPAPRTRARRGRRIY